jgi:hypothetical protein
MRKYLGCLGDFIGMGCSDQTVNELSDVCVRPRQAVCVAQGVAYLVDRFDGNHGAVALGYVNHIVALGESLDVALEALCSSLC